MNNEPIVADTSAAARRLQRRMAHVCNREARKCRRLKDPIWKGVLTVYMREALHFAQLSQITIRRPVGRDQ